MKMQVALFTAFVLLGISLVANLQAATILTFENAGDIPD